VSLRSWIRNHAKQLDHQQFEYQLLRMKEKSGHGKCFFTEINSNGFSFSKLGKGDGLTFYSCGVATSEKKHNNNYLSPPGWTPAQWTLHLNHVSKKNSVINLQKLCEMSFQQTLQFYCAKINNLRTMLVVLQFKR
jgi:hypothetical protein